VLERGEGPRKGRRSGPATTQWPGGPAGLAAGLQRCVPGGGVAVSAGPAAGAVDGRAGAGWCRRGALNLVQVGLTLGDRC